MWPPALGDSSFQIPIFPPPPPPPHPPQLFPPLPLSMLLRCLAPPGIAFPPPRAPIEVTPRPPISSLNQLEPNIEYAFPLFLQPSKIIPVQNGLEVKRTQRSYGSEEAAVSRKTKRLHRIARDENENTSSGSKKCKKISATALNDTNEHIEDIRRFARAFKMKRLSLGLTQTQIGRALTAGDGPAYSQSAICRFEKLDITPKSAQRIKPVLERWLAELEGRRPNDQMASHPTNLGNKNSVCGSVGSSPEDSGIYRADCESDESCAGIRKRKSRTNFSADALERLNHEFNINMHPSGTRISQLANQLNYDREVIRVWFCNKRQSFRNSGSRAGDQATPWLPFSTVNEDEVPIDLSKKASSPTIYQ
ncbi:POU domain, class 6, transcription factor 1 [Echinococcus granulosus]|nr:POU domain, class 6, transcription factor 1 [Echinococcus granulosus]